MQPELGAPIATHVREENIHKQVTCHCQILSDENIISFPQSTNCSNLVNSSLMCFESILYCLTKCVIYGQRRRNLKDVGSSYSNLVQPSLWNNFTDTFLGLQIWMNLKNKCIQVKYDQKSCICCFYFSNYVYFKNWLRKRIISHIHPGFNVFGLKFMFF